MLCPNNYYCLPDLLPVARIDHHVDAIFPVAADMQIVATCKIYHILTADNRSAAATDFKPSLYDVPLCQVEKSERSSTPPFNTNRLRIVLEERRDLPRRLPAKAPHHHQTTISPVSAIDCAPDST
ncbi:Uncharacterised protein [Escherichia coli]|uniref:Uncharacterized protein n=1 Tax=Escherichia coli TaxID=562 RepID=A0A2X3K4H3_ECOLX|nr:Uncharacterised protein [Escherichia coli]